MACQGELVGSPFFMHVTHTAVVSKMFLSFKIFAQPFPCSYGCVTYRFLQQAGKSPPGTACHQALLGGLQLTPGPHFPFRSRNLCPSSSAAPSYTLARVRPVHLKGLFQAGWLLYHSEEDLPDASTSHFKSRRHHLEPPLKQRPFCLLVKCPYCSSIVPAHQFPQATYSALLYQHQSTQDISKKTHATFTFEAGCGRGLHGKHLGMDLLPRTVRETWHWATWFNGHSGDELMVGDDDLSGLFQPPQHNSSLQHPSSDYCYKRSNQDTQLGISQAKPTSYSED